MKIQVRTLFEDTSFDMELRLMTSEKGLARSIEHPRIQKPGIALAGYVESLRPSRVQVLGKTEISFLTSLKIEERRHALAGSRDVNERGRQEDTRWLDHPVRRRYALEVVLEIVVVEAHVCPAAACGRDARGWRRGVQLLVAICARAGHGRGRSTGELWERAIH